MLEALSGGAPTALLVNAAMLLYVAGFLFRDQITLRLLVLSGTAFYIAYYYWHPAEPLWDAIVASVAIGVANLTGLVLLLFDRVPLLIGTNKPAYEAMNSLAAGTLTPGAFRRLMQGRRIERAAEPIVVTRAGGRPDELVFVIGGAVSIGKGDRDTIVKGPCFVGEIAFVTGSAASADTVILPRATYVSWPTDELQHKLAVNSRLDRALRALISYDMAAKVRVAPLLAR